MNNKIIEVQEILFREMKRLDDDEIMKGKSATIELARSTALYNQATDFIKAVNTNIKIIEVSKKANKRVEDMINYLGLENE